MEMGLAVSCVCALGREGGREQIKGGRTLKEREANRPMGPSKERRGEEGAREGQANLPALFISSLATYRYVLTGAPSAQVTCRPTVFSIDKSSPQLFAPTCFIERKKRYLVIIIAETIYV